MQEYTYFFLFLFQNIDCGYSLEPPRCTHNLFFEQKLAKYQNFSTDNFNHYNFKKSLFIARACFRNVKTISLKLTFET